MIFGSDKGTYHRKKQFIYYRGEQWWYTEGIHERESGPIRVSYDGRHFWLKNDTYTCTWGNAKGRNT
jgi:hypothetical protein